MSTISCHPFFHQMNPSRLPIFHFKRQAAQSLLGSNPLGLAFQFRNYDRKRYKFGRSFCKNRSRIRKGRLEFGQILPISLLFKLQRFILFHLFNSLFSFLWWHQVERETRDSLAINRTDLLNFHLDI